MNVIIIPKASCLKSVGTMVCNPQKHDYGHPNLDRYNKTVVERGVS